LLPFSGTHLARTTVPNNKLKTAAGGFGVRVACYRFPERISQERQSYKHTHKICIVYVAKTVVLARCVPESGSKLHALQSLRRIFYVCYSGLLFLRDVCRKAVASYAHSKASGGSFMFVIRDCRPCELRAVKPPAALSIYKSYFAWR